MNNRRTFIKNTALAAAAFAIPPIPFFAQGMPSRKLVVAVMGVRSRGAVLAQNFVALPNVEVACVCDVDQKYADQCVTDLEKRQGKKPYVEKDIRKVLENKDIDALVVAAPDHWHAPAALMAVKAGKHVYLEKPCSHNPREGEILVEAQQKYNRIIQMGNQRRSWGNVQQCMEELRAGVIGKVYFAKGWYANNRQPIGYGKPAPVPEGLDYELWQGPAPRLPYRDNVIHYNWHWFWHWGTGETCNNGTHEIDVMRWGMGVDFPSRVSAVGGRYHFKDDWQCPDTMVVTYEFSDGRCITWEQRSCNSLRIEGDGRGVIFYGEKGSVVQVGNGYTVYDNDGTPKIIKVVKPAETAANSTNAASPDMNLDLVHIKNFVDGIRDGKAVSSPISEGHKTTTYCHLANIAWRMNRPLQTDPHTGRILHDKKAMKLWGRDYEKGWEM